MGIWLCLFAGVILCQFSHAAVVLRPISSINIPYDYDTNGTGQVGILKGSVEQSAYDEETGLVYIVGDAYYIHFVDYSDVTDPVIVHKMRTGAPINDIEQCGSRVAFAAGARDQPGEVYVFSVYNKTTGTFAEEYPFSIVGSQPDMLHFTRDCNTIVVANEGSAFAKGDYIYDPEGSVSIIRLQETSPPDVTTLNFTSFNGRPDEYSSEEFRCHYNGSMSREVSTFSQGLEPEYVTFNMDETKAYICLQDNNAIAEVNLVTDSIDDIYPLGVKSWKNLVMDASDEDSGINLQSYDIFSFYQPDSIYQFEFNNKDYIVTGNEGQINDYNVGDDEWIEALTGRELVKLGYISEELDPDMKAALNDDARLGKLEFSFLDGLNAEDSKVNRLHFFGGRGISIFRADDMSLVWDSGDMVEKLHAEYYPNTFNADSKIGDPSVEKPKDLFDKRSDKYGPECEALTMGEIGDNTYLFVGVGRSSTVMIYRLEAASEGDNVYPVLEFESIFRAGGINDSLNNLLENEDIGNLDPEDLRFIGARNSPTGTPLLLVSGSTSGNLVMYEVVEEETPEPSGGLETGTNGCITLTVTLAVLLTLAIWK